MFDLHLAESRFITDLLMQHNFEDNVDLITKRPTTSKMEPNNTWHTPS